MKWNGSVVLITGASRGIGREIAVAASKRGARVGLMARSKDELNEVLAACGGKGAIAVGDVGERAQTEAAMESLQRELGPADILVNNAGIGAYGRVTDTDVETIEKMMRVNYFGTVYATKAVLPGMIERRRGHVVMIASIAGRIGAPLEAGYSASKFAMIGFAEALAFEIKRQGVGLSIIDPGPVETHFTEARGVPFAENTPKPVKPEAVAHLVIRAVERNKMEKFIPSWLSPAYTFKVLVPPAYRVGTMKTFGDLLK
ncbi:MAG TPA: SDR family NAD(P)-dependent oxidoreductase [Actinomycetota bacterium]|nr:SDR family NAD(P)-dependent oxidoreductase [Actinomycetota bacterium]